MKKLDTKPMQTSLCGHWSNDLPYRAIVPIKTHAGTATMLYQVAGSNIGPSGAEKAMRQSIKTHGGKCFYCPTIIAPLAEPTLWNLDHIEPKALGGKNDLSNFVLSCRSCNVKKGHIPIDSFNPNATKDWLTALQNQIEQRLAKL